MTTLWGPLGWMTLHSVSLIYPEAASAQDVVVASRFLELFAETISCPSCKSHFRLILERYKLIKPDFLSSRKNFAIFVFRAHNTVNARLDKPKPSTVAECIDTLKTATAQKTFKQFRTSYIVYLHSNWGRDFTGDGIVTRRMVKELQKINDEYWNVRDDGTFPVIEEDDVLTSIILDKTRFTYTWKPMSGDVGFKGGKLRLTRR